MILVVGGLYNGKRDFLKEKYGLSDDDFTDNPAVKKRAVINAEKLIQSSVDVSEVKDTLKDFDFVTVNDIACGIVPMEKKDRLFRERAGSLICELSKEAEEVYRIWYGVASRIK